MPKSCAVIGCNSNARHPERKFYRFPMLNNKSARSLDLTQKRQDKWHIALNRADFFPTHYKNATVCDRHFISGKSACYTDVENVDWVPSINLGYETKNEANEHSDINEMIQFIPEVVMDELNSDDNDEPTKGQQIQSNFLRISNDNNRTTEKQHSQSDLLRISVCTQTDDKFTGMSTDIIAAYQEKIAFLEEMLCREDYWSKIDSPKE